MHCSTCSAINFSIRYKVVTNIINLVEGGGLAEPPEPPCLRPCSLVRVHHSQAIDFAWPSKSKQYLLLCLT